MYLQSHGNILSDNSEGTNELIKQGAELVTSVTNIEDILSEIENKQI